MEYKRASKATTLAMSNANKKIDEMERVTNAQRKTVDSLQQQNEALEAKADAKAVATSATQWTTTCHARPLDEIT